jgi:hypothetical protein
MILIEESVGIIYSPLHRAVAVEYPNSLRKHIHILLKKMGNAFPASGYHLKQTIKIGQLRLMTM